VLVVSFGSRDADLPYQHAPSHYGSGALHSYVPVPPKASPMRSPLMEWEGGPPQIKTPPRSQTHTSYPEVLISGRSSSHPRGEDKRGWIEVERLRPGREEEAQVPQAPLTEDQAWWAQRMGR
jgi:hypothetical protein